MATRATCCTWRSLTFGGGGGGGGGYTVGADILSSADWYHHSIIYNRSTSIIKDLREKILTEKGERLLFPPKKSNNVVPPSQMNFSFEFFMEITKVDTSDISDQGM